MAIVVYQQMYMREVEVEIPDEDLRLLGGTIEERDDALFRILGDCNEAMNTQEPLMEHTGSYLLNAETDEELWDDN